jgi:hypothetical protein
VTVADSKSRPAHNIMVVNHSVDCVDEERSDILFFDEGNAPSPDMVGEYRMINILKLKTDVINRAIFRLKKFEQWVIVNEKVKHELEKGTLTGLKFISL